MIKNIVFSLVFLASFSPLFSYSAEIKKNFSLSDGVATTLKHEPILVALAGYTLAFRPEWLQEYPYISAFCGACLLGSLFRNTFARTFEFSKNSIIKTLVNCPFSTGLAAYTVAFNRELIREHPVAATLFCLWMGLQWTENIE